jgi:DNA-binding transcriptional LysR family regulator
VTDQWIGLELRHLVALRAIADEGSFKGAARALGYTPSAISQQIAGLERIVGVEVVAREHGRKALGPTEAGSILLRHMSAIEARLSAARADIDSLANGISGPLRVGAYESVAGRVLPEIIGRFRDLYPDVRIDVTDAALDLELLTQLERGLIDLAFAGLPLPPGPFKRRVVLTDPWILVVQSGSEHAARPAPRTLNEVGELPLVCFRASRALEPALHWFRAAGIELNIVLQSDYNEVVQEFAAAGLGVALMTHLATNPHDERTRLIELGELIPARQIAVVWRNDHTSNEAFERFISLAGETGARLEEERAKTFDWRRSAAV